MKKNEDNINEIYYNMNLGNFSRDVLDKATKIICSLYKNYQYTGNDKILGGEYHKMQCKNCKQELGYINGILEGSYIYKTGQQQIQ